MDPKVIALLKGMKFNKGANEKAVASLKKLIKNVPADYVEFVQQHNGGTGAESGIMNLLKTSEIRSTTREYEFHESVEDVWIIGTDGFGTALCIDARYSPPRFVGYFYEDPGNHESGVDFGETFAGFQRLVKSALSGAADNLKAGNAARASEREEFAAIVKRAAVKRMIDSDADLKQQVADAAKAHQDEGQQADQAEQTLVAASKAALPSPIIAERRNHPARATCSVTEMLTKSGYSGTGCDDT